MILVVQTTLCEMTVPSLLIVYLVTTRGAPIKDTVLILLGFAALYGLRYRGSWSLIILGGLLA